MLSDNDITKRMMGAKRMMGPDKDCYTLPDGSCVSPVECMHGPPYLGDFMYACDGSKFHPLNLQPEEVRIEVIAHALSNLCRYGGHTPNGLYSVAQHSVLVSYLADPVDALAGLLHDASEAYCCDVPRPLKYSGRLDGYIQIEDAIQKVITDKFGLPSEMPASVHQADGDIISVEFRDLFGIDYKPENIPAMWKNKTIIAWTQEESKRVFLQRFKKLTGGLM